MEEVVFGLTEMAWNGGSLFRLDWNVLEGWKSVWAGLEWFRMAEFNCLPH
jgi:hypothetical protein